MREVDDGMPPTGDSDEAIVADRLRRVLAVGGEAEGAGDLTFGIETDRIWMTLADEPFAGLLVIGPEQFGTFDLPGTAVRLTPNGSGGYTMFPGTPTAFVHTVPGLALTGGPEAGKALTTHPLVAHIAFTGGPETARHILRASAENLARTSLELGGKSPFIVFEDADLDSAVNAQVAGVFAATGQSCGAVRGKLYRARKAFAAAFHPNL